MIALSFPGIPVHFIEQIQSLGGPREVPPGGPPPPAPNTRTNRNTVRPLGPEGYPFPDHSVSSNPRMHTWVGGQSTGAPRRPSDIDSGNPSCTLRLACACWAGLDLLSLCLPSGNTEKGAPDNEVTQDHAREAHVGRPLLPAGCHVWDPGVHPQRLLGPSLQCCSDQPLWEGGGVRKQETGVSPAGLLGSHLGSLQLGPPHSGGLLGSAQLPTPPSLPGQGPAAMPTWGVGCGVSAPWPCPASGGRGVVRMHARAAVGDNSAWGAQRGVQPVLSSLGAPTGLHPGRIPTLAGRPRRSAHCAEHI